MMEKVNGFKYLGSILCTHGSMKGKVQEKALQGRKEIGSLECMMKDRAVSMKIKKNAAPSGDLVT